MKRDLRSIYLSLAFVAVLAAGFAIGRWSSQPSFENESTIAQSAHVHSNTPRQENTLVTPTPIKDGTVTTALDFNIATPNAIAESSQTFTFSMGFTR